MSYKITDNTASIKTEIKQKSSIFLRVFADDVVNESTPNTPKKTGALRRDVLREVLGLQGKIRWHKDYAAKMEAIQFRNYTTPGTGPHYAENAIRKVVQKTPVILRKVGLAK